MAKTATPIPVNDPVLEELENRIAEAGSQKACAEDLEISPSYLHDIIKGKRALTPTILNKLGYVRVSVHVPTERAEDVVKAIEKTLDKKTSKATTAA